MASAKKSKKSSGVSFGKAFFGDSRKGDLSLSFFAYVMILLVVGIVMMSSASYAWAYSEHGGDGLFYAKNQLKNAAIGFAAMIFFMKMDFYCSYLRLLSVTMRAVLWERKDGSLSAR